LKKRKSFTHSSKLLSQDNQVSTSCNGWLLLSLVILCLPPIISLVLALFLPHLRGLFDDNQWFLVCCTHWTQSWLKLEIRGAEATSALLGRCVCMGMCAVSCFVRVSFLIKAVVQESPGNRSFTATSCSAWSYKLSPRVQFCSVCLFVCLLAGVQHHGKWTAASCDLKVKYCNQSMDFPDVVLPWVGFDFN